MRLSVVAPVFNTFSCLPEFYRRLSCVLDELDELAESAEIIFVDDGSEDGSWSYLRELASRDDRVVALRLATNRGQTAAIAAGIRQSRGRTIVVMDADLQDPPEVIHRLYGLSLEGFEIVATRADRSIERSWRTGASKAYFALVRMLGASAPFAGLCMFSAISRAVADRYLALDTAATGYLASLERLGIDPVVVSYRKDSRFLGGSSYTLSRLFGLAVKGTLVRRPLLLRPLLALMPKPAPLASVRVAESAGLDLGVAQSDSLSRSSVSGQWVS